MSAAANKERLKLLMLAKKKDKIKPVKAKRVQEETKEETKEERKNEPEPVVVEEAPKKAKIEEEDVTALMVPVQLGEQVVNVDQELKKFFASEDQARDEPQGNEMEDEEKNEEAREEENGPDLEDAAKSLIRSRTALVASAAVLPCMNSVCPVPTPSGPRYSTIAQ